MAKKKKDVRSKFRDDVFARAGYVCERCDAGKSVSTLVAHHITNRNDMPGGGYVPENGIALCPDCHLKAEQWTKERGQAGFAPIDLYERIGSAYTHAVQCSLVLLPSTDEYDAERAGWLRKIGKFDEAYEAELNPCDYQCGTWECRGDGFLWDADNDGFDPSECDYPCPSCNTKEFLENRKEAAESTIKGMSNLYYYTGESLWLNGLIVAQEWNPEETEKALREIGRVEALLPADNEEGYSVKVFEYK